MTEVAHIIRPPHRRVPLVISCPHSGTELPPDLAARLDPALARLLPDTDWFVDELYDFAPSLGITLVRAKYSRVLIDLNRDPAGAKLYKDGRPETSLAPTRTFALDQLYRNVADEPTPAEIAARQAQYFTPYHHLLQELLTDLRQEFPQVLLYDAHSIRRLVPTIRTVPFPDMILGDQTGRTAAPELIQTALSGLTGRGGYHVAHNEPFMGGYITRSFGRPAQGQHALQLEMAQDIYMDEANAQRDPKRQGKVQAVLQPMLMELIATLARLGPMP